MSECAGYNLRSFNSSGVIVADQKNVPTTKLFQFAANGSVAAAKRENDSHFAQNAAPPHQFGSDERILAAFDYENDTATIIVYHIIETYESVPVGTAVVSTFPISPIQSPRCSVVCVAESPLMLCQMKKSPAHEFVNRVLTDSWKSLPE